MPFRDQQARSEALNEDPGAKGARKRARSAGERILPHPHNFEKRADRAGFRCGVADLATI